MNSCETKLSVSSAVQGCWGNVEGQYKSHVVVLFLVCNLEYVQDLDKDTLISMDFDECKVKSGLLMEVWVCAENIAAG